MASVGAFLLPTGLSSIFHREISGWPTFSSQSILISTKRLAVSNDQVTATKMMNEPFDSKRFEKKQEDGGVDTTTLLSGNESGPYAKIEELEEDERPSLQDYFEQAKEFIRSDGGPPRWFSPLECGSRFTNSPLLLFLPGQSISLSTLCHCIIVIWKCFSGLLRFCRLTELPRLIRK